MQQTGVSTWTIGYLARAPAVAASAIVVAIGALTTGEASAHSFADTATAALKAKILVADHQSQRHCHTIRTRMYCHSNGALPVNWPPLTTTPRHGQNGSGAHGHSRRRDNAAGDGVETV
jgi:predicted lipoprotein with Yx(FWY)xxD motif